MRGHTGDDLLKLPVRLHGIELARPVDIVVDVDARRAVGLELVCGDRANRFLPLGAATLHADSIGVASALALLDDGGFYLERARELKTLRGTPVLRRGREVGKLRDVVLEPDGGIAELVLADGARVGFAPDVTLQPAAARPAA